MDKKMLDAFAQETAKSIKTGSDLEDFRKMIKFSACMPRQWRREKLLPRSKKGIAQMSHHPLFPI